MFYDKPLNKTLNVSFVSSVSRDAQEIKKHSLFSFFHTRRRKQSNRNLNKLSRLPEVAGSGGSMPESSLHEGRGTSPALASNRLMLILLCATTIMCYGARKRNTINYWL
jgi:hypothetical protein